MIILHITRRTTWEAATAVGRYEADTLVRQGFVHCSKPEQVVDVANLLFRGQRGLVLLAIDTDRVKAPIRFENLEGGRKLFPHIYGPLNLDAVAKILPFEPREDGLFDLPAELRALSAEGKGRTPDA